tara:strand:+ start:5918 stop:7090 length:1173 start_codon:yes stop_codon:yes gene_type:complete
LVSPLKILFCSHEQFYPLSGGGTAGSIAIVNKMVQRGHDVTVMTPLYSDRKPLENKFGVKIEPFSPFYMHRDISLRGPKYLIYGALSSVYLLKKILQEDYDIVLIKHGVIGALGGLFNRFTNPKFAITYTDFLSAFLYESNYPNWIVNLMLSFERKIPKPFDRAFVITPKMKNEMINSGVDRNKIFVTYDGVDTDFFDPNKISHSQISEVKDEIGFDENIVIFHGTIEPFHGIKLMEKIILKNKDLNFLVIGGGRGYEKLKNNVMSKNVLFKNFVPYTEMPKYIAASNVGMIPYKPNYNLNCVLTLKLLEYLSMGNPVVTTNLESVSDIFGSYPFVRISNNTTEFSNNLHDMIKMEKSSESIELIKKSYSWDAVTTRISEKLEDLASPTL